MEQVLAFSALFAQQWEGIKLLLTCFLAGKSENNLIHSCSLLDLRLPRAVLVCEICRRDSKLLQLAAPAEAENPLETELQHQI